MLKDSEVDHQLIVPVTNIPGLNPKPMGPWTAGRTKASYRNRQRKYMNVNDLLNTSTVDNIY